MSSFLACGGGTGREFFPRAILRTKTALDDVVFAIQNRSSITGRVCERRPRDVEVDQKINSEERTTQEMTAG
jgi:hypothetical protein